MINDDQSNHVEHVDSEQTVNDVTNSNGLDPQRLETFLI